MADEADELQVQSAATRPQGRKYPGLSPLQAGLMYGGAASTVMGPFGLLIGLAAGIGAKRMKDSYLDREAKYAESLRAEQQGIQQQLDAEKRVADPDEARLLDHAKRLATDGWYRLQQGDRSGEQLITQANEISRSIMLADSQQRKQEEAQVASFQRGLVQSSADAMRTAYSENLRKFSEVDEQTQRVLELVASPGFDPNKPFNKAVLSDLLSVGVNGLYKDDPGGLAALAGAVPAIGDFLRGGVEAFKAEDYKLTAEDFNRIAFALKESNERYSEQTMSRLGDSASKLDSFARQIGAITGEYGIGNYVTGDVKELPLTAAPRYVAPRDETRAPNGERYRYNDPFSKGARRIEEWMNNRNRQRRRPTN